MNAEWWDPFSGRVTAAKTETTSGSGTTVALDLEPYGSRVLVFSKRDLPRTAIKPAAATAAPIDLSSGWRVAFPDSTGTVVDEQLIMDGLVSWTEVETTKYFSGVAAYEKRMNLPSGFLQPGLTVKLDFGEGKPIAEQPLRSGMQAWLDAPVREAAVVYINDRRVGSIWCPPYQVDVTSFLRPGDNTIRIAVANLALNYMAGRKLPDYRLLNLRYGERFQAQDMDKVQPIPSGLSGPIRLVSQPMP